MTDKTVLVALDGSALAERVLPYSQASVSSRCARYLGLARHGAVVLRADDPAAAPAQFAQAVEADLVLMSSSGRGGLDRLAHGSTASSLVRSAVPVIVVRRRHRTPHAWTMPTPRSNPRLLSLVDARRRRDETAGDPGDLPATLAGS